MQKVLICDDEANIRHILDFTLTAEGYAVVAACDGAEAFDVAVAETPDIILLDVMMPESDGFTTCRKLKQDSRTAHIPVVMLTARNSRGDRERGKQVMADDYITKPFSPQHVVETVQSMLGVAK